jgi:hypothetical protein
MNTVWLLTFNQRTKLCLVELWSDNTHLCSILRTIK